MHDEPQWEPFTGQNTLEMNHCTLIAFTDRQMTPSPVVHFS